MRTLKYILIGQTAVPTEDLLAWANWFETSAESRIVKQEMVEGFLVSTIFLGLDHNFSFAGAPILFETMVFKIGNNKKKPMRFQQRCSTWLQAEKMHQRGVDWLVRRLAKKVRRCDTF